MHSMTIRNKISRFYYKKRKTYFQITGGLAGCFIVDAMLDADDT